MPNAKDIDVTNLKVKCVAYGASGTGKMSNLHLFLVTIDLLRKEGIQV